MGNRKKALENNQSTYTGKVHSKCGTSEKYVSNFGCVKCLTEVGLEKLKDKELMAPYRTKEKQYKRLKEWREDNPDKLKEQRNRSRPRQQNYYQKNKESFKDKFLQRRYDISIHEYNSMLDLQNGNCKICNNPAGKKQLAVDHDHATGKVRGLLCSNCNTGLGLFKDDIKLLENARRYLICELPL